MSSPQVRALTDRAEIRLLLERDRIWAAYALGDLDDGMFEQCEWFAAGAALAMIFKGLSFFPLYSQGDAEGVDAILRCGITLPRVFLHQRPEHVPIVEKYYRLSELHPMWRMSLEVFRPQTAGALRLGMDRLSEIRELYRTDNGADAFAPYQLATGYFYGVQQDGNLVSVAGVHLASLHTSIGAIGNVFTHPAYRGRGFAGRCVSAVVEALQADGISTIILNVEQSNLGAVRVYERLGFVKYCPFIEGSAERM